MGLNSCVNCELYCNILNSFFVFNCDPATFENHNFYNVVGTIILSFSCLNYRTYVFFVFGTLFGILFYYIERYKYKIGIEIPLWRKNLYLESKTWRVCWQYKFQPKQLCKEFLKLQFLGLKRSTEFFLNNVPFLGKFANNCVNLCGNKTLLSECLGCEYYKYCYPTKQLAANRQIIVTILCMQKNKKNGNVWSKLSPDVVRYFCQNYLFKN